MTHRAKFYFWLVVAAVGLAIETAIYVWLRPLHPLVRNGHWWALLMAAYHRGASLAEQADSP